MADNTFVNIGGHKVSAGIKYSTTEVKTGDVWIDGKPIYRRTFTGTPSKSAGTYRDSYNFTISGFTCETLIKTFGFYTAVRNNITRVSQIGSASFSDDSSRTPTEESLVSHYPASNTVGVSVLCYNGFFTTVNNVTFTIYYTKTTD